MTNITTMGTRPFPLEIPSGYTLAKHPTTDATICIMAIALRRQFGNRPPTKNEWRALLRKIRFTQQRLGAVSIRLSDYYRNALNYDQWVEVVEHLAAAHRIATTPLAR